jgi:hypothetical protein
MGTSVSPCLRAVAVGVPRRELPVGLMLFPAAAAAGVLGRAAPVAVRAPPDVQGLTLVPISAQLELVCPPHNPT